MTRVTKIEPGVGTIPSAHDVNDNLRCTYHVIEADDGSTLVHLQVVGRKSSMSIQFDKAAASELVEIFSDAEVLERLAFCWDRLGADGFERLLVRLLDLSSAYTQVTRPTNVHGSDGGRDIQAYLKISDGLGSESLERVIVQAKHWPRRVIPIV
ncbi:hypothetical protein [Nocardia sp. NPDC046763]|uniref:hypothetical protein n=1 Tax=Nocardia sp. NPDC046763 TaxID=3155256 RepID=UPI0033CACF19